MTASHTDPADTQRVEHASEVAPQAPPPDVRRIARWGALALVVLTLMGLVPRLIQRARLRADAEARRNARPTVIIAAPKPAPDAALSLPASIESLTQTTINARTTGYVRNRRVDLGDRVRRGAILAEIEAPDVDRQYDQAQADAERATAGAAQADADLTRQQAALSQSEAQAAAAEAQVAQARANRDTADARVRQARHALEGQRANLRKADSQRILAARTWARYKSLLAQGFVTQQDADAAQSSAEATAAALDAARTAVSGAEADLRAAETARAAADASVRSAQASQTAARQQVVAAQAGLRSSAAGLRAAQAGRASGEANRRRYAVLRGFEQIVAPFDGVITSRSVDNGSLVKGDSVATSSSTTPGLFGIARLDVMRVMVNVPETWIPFLHVGDATETRVREFPDRRFVATLAHVAGGLDPASRTVIAEIHLRNPDGVLRPGMYAEVVLQGGGSARPLRVPAAALVSDAQGTRVATVVEGERIHFVPIVIDRDLGSEIEVARGLSPKDRIVTNPTDDLEEGTAVEVVVATPSGAPAAAPSGAPTAAPGAGAARSATAAPTSLPSERGAGRP